MEIHIIVLLKGSILIYWMWNLTPSVYYGMGYLYVLFS